MSAWWEGCLRAVIGEIIVDFCIVELLYFARKSEVELCEVGGPLSFLLGRLEEDDLGLGVGALKNISSSLLLCIALVGVFRGLG